MNAIELTLFTKRLVLEPLVKDHAQKMWDGFKDPNLYEFVPQEAPASVVELETRFGKLEGRNSPDGTELWLNWACRLIASTTYAGLIEITIKKEPSGSKLAYFIFSDFQKSGYAAEACNVVLEHIFKDYDVDTCAASIDCENKRSIALVSKLGFSKTAPDKAVEPFKGKDRMEATFGITRDVFANRSI